MKLKELKTIPNIFTFSRVLFGIIAFILLIKGYNITALILYVIGAFTDMLDGHVARKLKQASDLGSFLDAICDRIFILLIFFGLLISGRFEKTMLENVSWIILLPFWIFVELIIAFLVSKKTNKLYLSLVHRNSIRYAAVLFYITVGALMINFKYLDVLVIITVVLLIYALIDYIFYIRKL